MFLLVVLTESIELVFCILRDAAVDCWHGMGGVIQAQSLRGGRASALFICPAFVTYVVATLFDIFVCLCCNVVEFAAALARAHSVVGCSYYS